MADREQLVSVIIPVFNAEKYIEETICNIKGQTYKNWEIILVDDCSTDKSREIIKKHLSSNIKLFELKTNQGPAVARNYGVKKSKGKYIAFQDADDLWSKEKLEKQVSFMKKNDCAFSFTGYEFADEDGKPNGKKVHVPKIMSLKDALKNTTISTITVMFDMEKLTKDDIFMPDVDSEDTATWWNILKKIQYAYGIDDILSYYRRSKSTRSSNKIVAALNTWKLYRKQEKLGIIQSSYYFFNYAKNAMRRRIVRENSIDSIEILISTMNAKNGKQAISLIKKMNITSNALIINQITDKDINPFELSNKKTRLLSYREKGLSRSRNRAINNSNGELLLISDDDLSYQGNVEDTIKAAFKKYPKADIIAFYVESDNPNNKKQRLKEGRVGFLRSMKIQSVQLCIKKESITNSKISFDERFGTGTERYMGEENIFLFDCLKHGLKIYSYPQKIATIQNSKSTWFKGYDANYLRIKGLCFYRMSKALYLPLCMQFAIRKKRLFDNMTISNILGIMLAEIKTHRAEI